jgi:RNA polymerase sigma factor (sigma-70 family)
MPPEPAPPTETAASGERRREQFLSIMSRHLQGLYHFVRHQLAYHEAVGNLLPGELTPEDVVDAVVVRAYREFVGHPPERKVKTWLLRLARGHLAAEVKRRTEERETTVHIEEDVPETPPWEWVSTLGEEILYFYEPDEDLKLEDLLPDLSVPTPEQEVERTELQRCMEAALAEMPREWRRVLLLCHVARSSARALAGALGRPAAELERILDNARAFLRQRLVESGCVARIEPRAA